MHEIAGTSVTADNAATREVYARIACGGADTCNCLPCRNFRLARDDAFPPEFRSLLDELGIDYRKELEVYGGEPLPGGRHHYEGWFCFVGKAYGRAMPVSTPNTATDFMYRIADTAPGPQREFDGHDVLHLEFRTTAPWRLEEPWTLEGLPRLPLR